MIRITDQTFEEIVETHGDAIYRVCKAYWGFSEDLDDVYQEVLINLWKSLPSFKGHALLSTWIYRVAVNTTITHRRKRIKAEARHTVLNDWSGFPEDPGDREEKAWQEDQYHLLLKSIARLKPGHRIMIGLYLEDLSYREIADVIGKDTSYVGVNLKRIKEKLSKLMRSERVG